jgi:hypothetical protein
MHRAQNPIHARCAGLYDSKLYYGNPVGCTTHRLLSLRGDWTSFLSHLLEPLHIQSIKYYNNECSNERNVIELNAVYIHGIDILHTTVS